MAVKRRIGFPPICVPKHPATRRPTVGACSSRGRGGCHAGQAFRVTRVLHEVGKHSLDLTRTAMSYTLRTTHTMRAMRIIVPRIPPIYIRISINASEWLLTHTEASLSGRQRTLAAGDALRLRPHLPQISATNAAIHAERSGPHPPLFQGDKALVAWIVKLSITSGCATAPTRASKSSTSKRLMTADVQCAP
jgi:hypothetical protein